jgi:hypothetical protein
MVDDPFTNHRAFPTGVWWQPTDYKPMDQTVYLHYANRRINDLRDSGSDRLIVVGTRGLDETTVSLRDLIGARTTGVETTEEGLVVYFEYPSQEKHGA